MDRFGKAHNIKDPFVQASKNRYSILKYLEKKKISHPFFETGVAFPDTVFRCSGLDHVQEQVYDASYGRDFFTYIRKLANYYSNKLRHCKGSQVDFRSPTANEITNIRQALRPNYEAFAPLRVKIESERYIHIKLTEEQNRVLDELQYADSAIIHGPAGTGKTLLAIEMAKRRAGRDNVKVALVTYGLLLTDYLKNQVKDFDNIFVFSISDYFEKKCEEYGLIEKEQRQNLDNFYLNIIPKKALEILTIESIEFDTIIIDEAQDFSAAYLLVLSQMLKGHIAKGNYYFFGDFIYQGLFDSSVYQKEFRCYIEAMGGQPVDKELLVNVRNSYDVQKELDLLANTSTESIHKKGETEPDIYRQYDSEEDELKQLEKVLNVLIHNEKIKPSQITILGRRHFNESVAGKITKYKIDGYKIPHETENITFSSIRKFKGLENDIILVVDNDHYRRGSYDLHVLYVAISRAAQKVIVFESKEAQRERAQILSGR